LDADEIIAVHCLNHTEHTDTPYAYHFWMLIANGTLVMRYCKQILCLQ